MTQTPCIWLRAHLLNFCIILHSQMKKFPLGEFEGLQSEQQRSWTLTRFLGPNVVEMGRVPAACAAGKVCWGESWPARGSGEEGAVSPGKHGTRCSGISKRERGPEGGLTCGSLSFIFCGWDSVPAPADTDLLVLSRCGQFFCLWCSVRSAYAGMCESCSFSLR